MTEPANVETEQSSQKFAWHPEHIGKTYDSVRRSLEDDILRDQRAYDLALNEAENEEFGAFNTVRELEKRWSDYDFGWVDVPPQVLADRVLAFERARDERRELISWQDWKAETVTTPEAGSVAERKPDWRENLTDEQRRKFASAASVGILFLLAVACVGAYMLIR